MAVGFLPSVKFSFMISCLVRVVEAPSTFTDLYHFVFHTQWEYVFALAASETLAGRTLFAFFYCPFVFAIPLLASFALPLPLPESFLFYL